MSDVKPEWAEHARRELAWVASQSQTVTYGDLYDRLRLYIPAWPVRRQGQSWINTYLGPTLSAVARLNKLYGEPLLTALVRNADSGYVGSGYQTAVLIRYDVSLDDGWINHSQVETGKCHRFFGEPK
jgi:hypothetical protein